MLADSPQIWLDIAKILNDKILQSDLSTKSRTAIEHFHIKITLKNGTVIFKLTSFNICLR